jgi:hypothetical protein
MRWYMLVAWVIVYLCLLDHGHVIGPVADGQRDGLGLHPLLHQPDESSQHHTTHSTASESRIDPRVPFDDGCYESHIMPAYSP